MSAFYASTMRRASGILFAVALLMIVAGIICDLLLINKSAHDFPLQSDGLQLAMTVQAMGRAIEQAVWPLFGSALLWRIDRYFSVSEKEAAE